MKNDGGSKSPDGRVTDQRTSYAETLAMLRLDLAQTRERERLILGAIASYESLIRTTQEGE